MVCNMENLIYDEGVDAQGEKKIDKVYSENMDWSEK